MSESFERCVICLSSRRCAHTRPHSCKGMSDEPCGPWPICVKCSNLVCQKFVIGGKEALSGQFGCPICKAELGPRRRALEEGSEVTQWQETPDTPEQAWQAPRESAAQRAMRERNLPELRRLLGVVPSSDRRDSRQGEATRSQRPATSGPSGLGDPPTPDTQRQRWAAVLSRRGQAKAAVEAAPVSTKKEVPEDAEHEHHDEEGCKEKENQRLAAELQKREGEVRRREEEACKERERLRLETEHRQRREAQRQQRKEEMERKEKERLQLEAEQRQREAELKIREEKVREETERLRLEAEHRAAKLQRREEEARKERERLRLEAKQEAERQRQELEAHTERERLRLEMEHRQWEAERRKEEAQLRSKAVLALGSLSQLYLATVPPSSKSDSRATVRAAEEEAAQVKLLQAEAKAAEHVAVEAAVAAAQAEQKHRHKPGEHCTHQDVLSSPRPLVDRRRVQSKRMIDLDSPPLDTPAQACRALDDAALSRCPDALLQAFFAEYVQEKESVCKVAKVMDTQTPSEREASKRLHDEVAAIRREATIRRRSFSVAEAQRVRQQHELEANLRLESERQRCKQEVDHRRQCEEAHRRAWKAAKEQERLRREADASERRRQDAERRQREKDERLRLEIECSKREAEHRRREEEARPQIEVERRSREEEQERLCLEADRRRLIEVDLRRRMEVEARVKIEAECRRLEEQESLRLKAEHRRREDEKTTIGRQTTIGRGRAEAAAPKDDNWQTDNNWSIERRQLAEAGRKQQHWLGEARREMQQNQDKDDAEQKTHALEMKRRQLGEEERRVAEKRRLLCEQESVLEHKRRRLGKETVAPQLMLTLDASPVASGVQDVRPVQTPARADRTWAKSHISRGKCPDGVSQAVSSAHSSQDAAALNMETTDQPEGVGQPASRSLKDDALLARIKNRMDSATKSRSAAVCQSTGPSSHVPSSSSSAPATHGKRLLVKEEVKEDQGKESAPLVSTGADKACGPHPPAEPSSDDSRFAPSAKSGRVAATAAKSANGASGRVGREAGKEKVGDDRKASSMLARMQMACMAY